MIHNAHVVCSQLRSGETPKHGNGGLAAGTECNMIKALNFTSNVLLSYPDCFRHTYSDGD